MTKRIVWSPSLGDHSRHATSSATALIHLCRKIISLHSESEELKETFMAKTTEHVKTPWFLVR
jgi:hypothetical protein